MFDEFYLNCLSNIFADCILLPDALYNPILPACYRGSSGPGGLVMWSKYAGMQDFLNRIKHFQSGYMIGQTFHLAEPVEQTVCCPSVGTVYLCCYGGGAVPTWCVEHWSV